MIQCPNCEKGLIWGVYLDIPPEMKTGLAEWVGCEVPEPESVVTCPSCEQEAGPYKALYQQDSDSRRLVKEQVKSENLNRIQIRELPGFHLFGSLLNGNYRRASFLQEAWEVFSDWTEVLNNTHHYPKTPQIPEISLPPGLAIPLSMGIRLDNPEEIKPGQCRYIAAYPLAERYTDKIRQALENLEIPNPKGGQILEIPPSLYACLDFEGGADEFLKVDRFLLKTWLAERKTEFNLAPGPHLELYPLKLSTWPPQDKDLTIGHLTATLCIPIAPAPLPPEEPAKEEISSDESSLSNDE